jgi:hypothetical protein
MAEFGKSRTFLKAMPGVLLTLCIVILLMAVVFPILAPVRATGVSDNTHLGVASCAGSTCHGRLEADGAVVRQDEVLRWQEPWQTVASSAAALAALAALAPLVESTILAHQLAVSAALAASAALAESE